MERGFRVIGSPCDRPLQGLFGRRSILPGQMDLRKIIPKCRPRPDSNRPPDQVNRVLVLPRLVRYET